MLTIRYLALLGGYDAEFTTRDPWTNLTRFTLDAAEKAKGRPSGKILYSEENSDGLPACSSGLSCSQLVGCIVKPNRPELGLRFRN